MIAEAPSVGPAPIVIVPYRPFGEEIVAAIYRMPRAELPGLCVSHEANMPSGSGTGYVGTINGIHVYSGPSILAGRALLCSSRLIRIISYGVVYGKSDVADFSFVDGQDLARSRVLLKFAQHIEWADNVFVEFKITGRNSSDS